MPASEVTISGWNGRWWIAPRPPVDDDDNRRLSEH
jgi:hypothetical protein